LVHLPKFHEVTIRNEFRTDNVEVTMIPQILPQEIKLVPFKLESIKQKITVWLRQGISPGRLALTLALGFAIGCIPVMGVTTALCVVAALTLRLNLPIIQAANWSAMPLQLILLVPFVRLGRHILPLASGRALDATVLLHSSPLAFLTQVGGLAGQALLAWVLIATPSVALLTLMLTAVLRRVPAVAAVEAGE
jgi:uncharacterized protein (DUF2062 family)